MVEAAQQGRNLVLTVEGREPFVFTPLPGWAGLELTETYIKVATRKVAPDVMESILMLACDGVDAEREWVLNGPNWTRMRDELSLSEGEDVALPVLFWQTILGFKGVEEFLSVGGGLAGGVKALRALLSTLGISPLTTSPSSELETLIQTRVSTITTSTQPGGGTLAKLPSDKQSRKPKQSKKRPTA